MTATITDSTTSRRSTRSLRNTEKGLDGIAGGGHFFDLLTDDVITTPGYPRRVEGRNAVAEMYRPYGTMIVLDRCHDPAVDHDIKDAVLSTWTLCTVPNMDAALAEIWRVLKPGGSFHFVEHGNAPDEKVVRWQERLEPLDKRLAGGCHLTRHIAEDFERAGFEIEKLDRSYFKGEPKPMGYTYEGRAIRR